MKQPLEILLTADQLDDLIMLPRGTCQRFIEQGYFPKPQNQSSEPRWGKKGFVKWLRILSTHAVDESGKPPLANMGRTFRESRSIPTTDVA